MSTNHSRKCRCGNERFYAHQVTRHDVVVDPGGAYQRDIGVYDAEEPYGPFTCTQCEAVYDELSEISVTENRQCIYFRGAEYCLCNNAYDDPGECIYENGVEPPNPALPCPHYSLHMPDEDHAEIATAICLNGKLRVGDLVLSTPDDDYACLVGTVLAINLLGTPEHGAETDNDADDGHVDFRNTAYSWRRRVEIAKRFSELYGEKKDFQDCPIDDAIMAPKCLIRITGIDDDTLMKLLACERNAEMYCRGVKASITGKE